jgi:hypothetical protein
LLYNPDGANVGCESSTASQAVYVVQATTSDVETDPLATSSGVFHLGVERAMAELLSKVRLREDRWQADHAKAVGGSRMGGKQECAGSLSSRTTRLSIRSGRSTQEHISIT